MGWEDRSVLEAASWRLASELVRRHPERVRLIRAHPGRGQSDCLWIMPSDGTCGDIRLNRHGTIQVLERFDGRPSANWPPTEWDAYLRADPREFLHRLEHAAGLPQPPHVPPATPTTLTYRILAAIAATAVKAVHPIEIQPGYIDTSGYGGGHNEALRSFPAIPADLLRSLDDDFYGQPGYRFWVVLRDDVHILSFEQRDGVAWTPHHTKAFPLMKAYQKKRRNVAATAAALLERTDQI